jgi:starch phosphorylase
MSTRPVIEGTERGVSEDSRTGLGVDALKRAMVDNVCYALARFPEVASATEWYQALAYAVRDRLLFRWLTTARTCKRARARTVCYLSAEYLPGPQLGNNVLSLGIGETVRQAAAELGLDLDALCEVEEEPGLGNGGLGRLASCFMDSMATLQIPAIGYGIRYEFGIFDQQIRDGWQVEKTDKWLHAGNPWEVARPRINFDIKLGGYTEHFQDDAGQERVLWIPEREVRGVAHDTPMLGYRVNNVNLLRLWSAEAPESFDLAAFNTGDYYRAVNQKVVSENLTKVLYPNDEPETGKQLRLEQQYFFVSCSLQDMLRIYKQTGDGLDRFHEKYVVQLNDTHPAIGVAELMRLLMDENHLDWETAWNVTRRTFAYTNHTLLPEALEKWPVRLFEKILPRHLEIIYEINGRFLDEVQLRFPDDPDIARRVSLIEEDGQHFVRMANLAAVGSHAINGVSKMHTGLLKESVLGDFYRLTPEKFHNITNGVTPRRFLLLSNPRLSDLVSESLGGGEWVNELERLKGLERHVDDPGFRHAWRAIKRANKERLAAFIKRETQISVDPDSLFDIQVKRIHEYKRQHLNLLNIITIYDRLKRDPNIDVTPRTFIFGGKAAPGYFMAKLIIKLITSVAEVINNDPDVRDRLKVVFLPEYNVKNAQRIYPAADISEQISLAGKEASGTGNMKLAMNGALTIGTLDGANVEIREAVGEANFFAFGLTAAEVQAMKTQGYNAGQHYQTNSQLRTVVDLVASGVFSGGDRNLFRPLVDALMEHDEYMLFADYQPYADAQLQVGHAYKDMEHWTRMSVLNVARMGCFSSDRAIREYAKEIWRVEAVPIEVSGSPMSALCEQAAIAG